MRSEYLFIYGIFRDVSHNLLGDAEFCGKASVCGRIYKVDEFYPGYVESDCSNKVYGDIYLVDTSVLKELDEYEGPEYNRRKIMTSIDIEAWIYEYIQDVSKFDEIDCGDWLLR